MTGKDMIKLMERNGWKVVRVKGSHHIMEKEVILKQSQSMPAKT